VASPRNAADARQF